jgi:hypothetical protein
MSAAQQPNTAGQAFFLRCWLEPNLAEYSRRILWDDAGAGRVEALIEAEALCHATKAGFAGDPKAFMELAREFLHEAVALEAAKHERTLERMTASASRALSLGAKAAAQAAAQCAREAVPKPPPSFVSAAVESAIERSRVRKIGGRKWTR